MSICSFSILLSLNLTKDLIIEVRELSRKSSVVALTLAFTFLSTAFIQKNAHDKIMQFSPKNHFQLIFASFIFAFWSFKYLFTMHDKHLRCKPFHLVAASYNLHHAYYCSIMVIL